MNKKIIIPVIIIDILMVLCYFLAYGPISYFRNMLITTAMTTKEHKYLARTFYSEKTIANVLSENTIIELGEDTDSSQINFEKIKKKTTYDSIYEEEVLKKDNEDDEYKIVNLSGNNYKGYMVVVYKPENITLAVTKYLGRYGQTVRQMSKDNDAKIAINAGGFEDYEGVGTGGAPTGSVIKDGVLIYGGNGTGWNSGIVGFNDKHVLVLTKDSPEAAIEKGIKDAVEFGPFLIVNGKKAITKGNGGWGISSRTVIAQRKDGIVLFFIIDGRQPGYSVGITLSEMTALAYRYGAYNASNMDGGASTVLVVNNKVVNKPCGIGGTGERSVPNAWIVK